MNIAAYCRVSTDKVDQLGSLETQKAFFSEYQYLASIVNSDSMITTFSVQPIFIASRRSVWSFS